MSGPYFLADEIARAFVEACRLTGENPEVALVNTIRLRANRTTPPPIKAKSVAILALEAAFPEMSRAAVISAARGLGAKNGKSALWNARVLQRDAKWWNELWVDEIVGVLVADQYEARVA
jgi:hypothetical protein